MNITRSLASINRLRSQVGQRLRELAEANGVTANRQLLAAIGRYSYGTTPYHKMRVIAARAFDSRIELRIEDAQRSSTPAVVRLSYQDGHGNRQTITFPIEILFSKQASADFITAVNEEVEQRALRNALSEHRQYEELHKKFAKPRGIYAKAVAAANAAPATPAN